MMVLAEDPTGTLRKYTEHTSDLYSQVNFSLASDSSALEKYADYIKELRATVLATPLLENPGVFFRGVDLSALERNQMEKLGKFFIPSFTSTSIDPSKCYSKSATLHIRTSFFSKYACSITSEHSNYYESEREVLLVCYSAFQLERIELVGGKHVVTLFLDDNACLSNRL
eukprot:TRINITY_DN3418_c0_g1_i3.p1 TRINITY_DN3418_c0_g1~~TRINITY_DN3418_c0_g1_i3.p1  ORF type:complete len:170 (-),score=29.12 TRINITY_DN3418_c0_g1_i3:49-558(-)